MRLVRLLPLAVSLALAPFAASAQSGQKWVTSWAASVQGPYPVGNPSAQPDLRFAFPVAATGARDQTFRLIVQPDIWGRQARLRLSQREPRAGHRSTRELRRKAERHRRARPVGVE